MRAGEHPFRQIWWRAMTLASLMAAATGCATTSAEKAPEASKATEADAKTPPLEREKKGLYPDVEDATQEGRDATDESVAKKLSGLRMRVLSVAALVWNVDLRKDSTRVGEVVSTFRSSHKASVL